MSKKDSNDELSDISNRSESSNNDSIPDIRFIQKRRREFYFALGKPRKDWDETFSTLSQNIWCVEYEKQVILALWENVKKISENLENVEENKKKK